jgi:hypothetical protein
MSEARTPEAETVETDLAQLFDEDVPVEDEYDGPDPEDDPRRRRLGRGSRDLAAVD